MGYEWETLEGRIRIDLAKRVIRETMPDMVGKPVLDVGCRTGNFMSYMTSLGAVVYGVDLHKESLKIAAESNAGMRLICADATTDKLPIKNYNLVFAKDIIEHLDEPVKLLNNMRAHQKQGGKIIIGTQNSLSLTYLIDGFYAFLSGNVWRGYSLDHKHFFSARKFDRILRESGYKTLKYYSTYHWPYLSVNKRLFGRYGESIIYHGIDRLKLNAVWPFSITGWWICVVGEAV